MAILHPPDAHTGRAPEAWEPAQRAVARAFAPIERFLKIEAASGIVLLLAAAIALGWANSPWHASYDALWHTPMGVRIGAWAFERDLHFWVNDALMTIFFFVVGLEIRREMHDGELSDLRRAALPIAAALGGMVVPATIYAAVNHGRPTLAGWGVPMATDIAFAVGALTLLGRRAPPALRVLLLALAVVDDVGAIVVIALFYSAGIVGSGVAVAALGGAIVLVMQRLGVRSPLAYVAPGAVLWFGMLGSGIHPTLAGVVLGLLTPARTWLGAEGFATVAGETVEGVRSTTDSHEIAHQVATLRRAQREVLPPAVRLQHLLHPWVAFGIMPLFALANAGVRLEGAALEGDGAAIAAGVGLGLVVGKPLGVVLASWLALRMGVASLPAGLSVRGLLVVGTVAGIGFTMALFVAELAFGSGAELEVAKLAILGGSIASAVAGLVLGRTLLAGAWAPGTAPTERDAETSTTA